MTIRTENTPFAIGEPYSVEGSGATAILSAAKRDEPCDTSRKGHVSSTNGLTTVDPVDWDV